jgi:hypothetical protein
LLQGKLTEYEHRSDESGRWLKMNFCPKCGTTVFHTAELQPGVRTVTGGTFDDPDWFRIDRHIWVQSKRPWVSIPAGVATFQQGDVAAPPPAQQPDKTDGLPTVDQSDIAQTMRRCAA